MTYIVVATTQSKHGASGTFPADTAKDALEKVYDLRKQGLTVHITDDRGNPVNEEALEDEAEADAQRQ
jgi:hypothetical protein